MIGETMKSPTGMNEYTFEQISGIRDLAKALIADGVPVMRIEKQPEVFLVMAELALANLVRTRPQSD